MPVFDLCITDDNGDMWCYDTDAAKGYCVRESDLPPGVYKQLMVAALKKLKEERDA